VRRGRQHDTLALYRVSAWRRRIFGEPQPTPPRAWRPDRLAYVVSVATPEANGEQAVLAAPRYSEGRLDWYAFDAAPGETRLAAPAGAGPAPATREDLLSFVPTAASFPGMPDPRFWEMEDRRVNFGSLNAKTTDHLLLVFAEMGLVYGNDWFVIPFEMPVNYVCEVQGLVVTDVFGDRTLIQPANGTDETAWQRWSLFAVAGEDRDDFRGRYFWLPASLASVEESDPIEELSFTRDEMANLAWAVEDTVPDGTGKGIETRLVVIADAPPALPPATTALVRYARHNRPRELGAVPARPPAGERPGHSLSARDHAAARIAAARSGAPRGDPQRIAGALLRCRGRDPGLRRDRLTAGAAHALV
jgi:hypothetical protein